MSNVKKASSKLAPGEEAFYGPGSTLEKLHEFKPKLYKCLTIGDHEIAVDFNTKGLITIPTEVFLNEQVAERLVLADLSNNKIKKVPPSFATCEKLVKVNLSNNLIKTLPGPTIKKLANLVELDASKNQIKTLPRTLNKSVNLRTAKFSNNNIRKLPPTLGNCTQLEYLDLSHNIITTLPKNIYNLRRELNVSHNSIEAMPVIEETKKIKLNITKMNLSYNEIFELPEDFFELYHLEQLNLAYNQLQEVTVELPQLKFLNTLNLEGNKLTDLPVNFGSLCYSLKYLNISNNFLTHLPDTFTDLEALFEINISKNSLSKLPPISAVSGFGKQIKTISLSENQLTSIGNWVNSQRNLSLVKSLNLNHNKIEKIADDALLSMNDLIEFLASHNKLISLPDSLSFCRHLKTVDVSNNCLIEYPAQLGECSTLLNYVDFSNNLLTTLPSNIRRKFYEIKHLKFTGNNLSRVDDSLRFLHQIEVLELDQNPKVVLSSFIKNLPNSKCLHTLKFGGDQLVVPEKLCAGIAASSFVNSLTTLDLSNLGLIDIPYELSEIRCLRKLNLQKNKLGPDLSEIVGELKSLRELDLSENKICSPLSGNFKNLKTLYSLNISKNRLTKFDSPLCCLKSLHRLDCSKNYIESLPANFGKLIELQELNLSANRLKEFPNDKLDVLASLQKLDLSFNYIEKFPEDMPYLYRLEVINATSNNILELPLDIFKMKSLTELKVGQNLLTAVPIGVSKLPNLKILSVDNNRLTPLPEAIVLLSQKGAHFLLESKIQESHKSVMKMPDLKAVFNELNKIDGSTVGTGQSKQSKINNVVGQDSELDKENFTNQVSSSMSYSSMMKRPSTGNVLSESRVSFT